MKIAIADTCFLINWLKYKRKNDILKLFKLIMIPLPVLDELGSEGKALLGQWIIKGYISFIPRLEFYDSEAYRIIELAKIRSLPRIDYPEAYCLVVASKRNYVVLTENKATRYIVSEINEYKHVRVLDSLDVLLSLYGNDKSLLTKRMKEYMQDTGIIFSRKRLKRLGISLEQLSN